LSGVHRPLLSVYILSHTHISLFLVCIYCHILVSFENAYFENVYIVTYTHTESHISTPDALSDSGDATDDIFQVSIGLF